MDTEKRYRIVRLYERAWMKHRVIKRGLTLAEAQAHCRNPETSSTTAKGDNERRRTEMHGPWFDGYEAE